MTMPFYASAEQIMRDRSEFARKGIARGRSVVVLTYADGVLFVAENASSALHKVSEIYDRIGFAGGRQVQRVREPAGGRHPARRPAWLLLRPPRRHRPRAGERLRADARHDLHRAAEALRGGDLRRRGRRDAGRRPAVPALLRRHDRRRAGVPRDGRAGRRADQRDALARFSAGPSTCATRLAAAVARARLGRRARTATPRALPASQLEVAVLDRTRGKRKFRRITGLA